MGRINAKGTSNHKTQLNRPISPGFVPFPPVGGSVGGSVGGGSVGGGSVGGGSVGGGSVGGGSVGTRVSVGGTGEDVTVTTTIGVFVIVGGILVAVIVGGSFVAVFVGGGLVGVALGMMIPPPPDEVRVGKTAIGVRVGVRLGVTVRVAVAPVIGIEITSASVDVGSGVSGRTGVAVSVKKRSANAC